MSHPTLALFTGDGLTGTIVHAHCAVESVPPVSILGLAHLLPAMNLCREKERGGGKRKRGKEGVRRE